jgi:CheY-like chemotaxis protein
MSHLYREPIRVLLCIDDNHAILEYERSLFQRAGYIVITADSARLGLRLAKMFSFDTILLDYHMPELDGQQLAIEIRRSTPQTFVVMFSGAEIPEETQKLVDAVVSKGETSRELLPTVANLLQRGRA